MQNRQWRLAYAAQTVLAGGVIAYPTESVFGLGCDPDCSSALEQILQIKNRPAKKGLIILVSDLSQALPYLKPLKPSQIALIEQTFAQQMRATTWLIPCLPEVTPLLRGQYDCLAVRITQHPVARMICQHMQKPLVSTSCNIAGKSEMTQVTRVRNQMYTQVEQVVSGRCGGQSPSTIIDMTSRRVIRQ
ncbi:L-threonylcarbamoyladenylate synthase [Aliikangiella maris]|uniref:Threonylcarbamoyl-AMP synthase n=2 Tax=Aliikangiella maris TaxID=3162458 RepID=A0ABV3MSR4_9GAMM